MASEGNRTGLGVPAWIIALLAMFGIGSALIAPHAPAPAAKTPSQREAAVTVPSGGDEVPPHSAAELLENFLDTNPEEVNREQPWSSSEQPRSSDDQPASTPREALTDERGDYRIRFLIATLPEPGPPPLRSVFDTDLDAISFALGRAGYALASFDLPWLEDAGSDAHDFRLGQTIDLTLLGLTTPIATITPEDEHRAEHAPGVMLFHREKSDEPKKDEAEEDGASLLVLFLVGESPTRGVNQTALRDALDQIAWLSRKKPGNPVAPPHLVALARKGEASDEIRIIGPNFSGSAVSLHDTLTEWATSFPSPHPKTRPRVRIISGAATAITAAEMNLNSVDVNYSSLRVPDATMLQSIERRFRGDDHHGPPIVMLTENTSYGTAGIKNLKDLEDKGTAHGFRTIPFPLHISDLRTASGNAAAGSLALESPTAAHNLPLPDEAGQQERDVVPAFSERSKVYDELVLQNDFQQIRAERTRYVGVVATDVEDLIFLVRKLRANCPDVVIFTISSELLFTHSGFAPDLAGLLVFSTFPLFSPVQAWTNGAEADERSVQFPTEAAEGFYDATLAQLDKQQWMLDYGAPFYGRPTPLRADLRLPVLWLSVVGRENLWPITFERESLKEMPNAFPAAVPDSAAPPNLGELYPLSFQVVSLLLTALFFIPCIAFLWPTREHGNMPGPGVERPRLNLLIGQSIFPDLQDEREQRVAAFVGVLLVAYLLWLSFYLLPLWAALGWASLSGLWSTLQWPVRIIAGFGVVATLGTAVVIVAFVVAFSRAWRSSWKDLVHGWQSICGQPYVEPFDPLLGAARGYWVQPTGASFVFIGLILGVALVISFIATIWLNSPAETLMYFVRSVNLGNRVSPLMPLIYLGAANLCLIGGDLWRLRLLEDCRVPLPFLGFDEADSFRDIAELERGVIKALERPTWELPGWWLRLILPGVFVYFLYSNGGSSVFHNEEWVFDWPFLALAAFTYSCFSILLVRFVAVWRALHRLLRRLYWHPSRNAYEELRVATLPGRSEDQHIRLFEPQPTLTAAEYCLERAREIVGILDPYPAARGLRDPIAAAIAWGEACLRGALTADRDQAGTLTLRILASRAIAGLSREIVRLVEPEWRLVRGPSPMPLHKADQQKLMEAARLFIASRVVDFLRQVFPQLRNLAVVAMIGVLALMLALNVYPFVQRDTLVWLSWIVLLSVIGVGFTVFIQINRNRVVSMLMGTTPGRFNWDSSFSLQLLVYGLLPILTLLGAQFPHVFDGFLSWGTGLFGGAKQSPP